MPPESERGPYCLGRAPTPNPTTAHTTQISASGSTRTDRFVATPIRSPSSHTASGMVELDLERRAAAPVDGRVGYMAAGGQPPPGLDAVLELHVRGHHHHVEEAIVGVRPRGHVPIGQELGVHGRQEGSPPPRPPRHEVGHEPVQPAVHAAPPPGRPAAARRRRTEPGHVAAAAERAAQVAAGQPERRGPLPRPPGPLDDPRAPRRRCARPPRRRPESRGSPQPSPRRTVTGRPVRGRPGRPPPRRASTRSTPRPGAARQRPGGRPGRCRGWGRPRRSGVRDR